MGSCRFKKQRTESEAREYAARKRADPETSNLRAYRCHCGYWHVGHKYTPEEAKQAVSDSFTTDLTDSEDKANPPKPAALGT